MNYTKPYYWLTENSRNFLANGYLREGVTGEQRVKEIAYYAEEVLGVKGLGEEIEHYASLGYYSFSTPVWCNFGKDRKVGISCYGSYTEDNLPSILDTGVELGMMSKYGGGTSAYLGNIRPRGSKISTGGIADGPVHYAHIYDTIIDKCKQAESRKGACAVWLPIEHPDIMEFLDIGTEGNDIQNLQFGVTVTDAFMEKMIAGDRYSREVWAKVIARRREYGFPYIMFFDTVNNYSPYKNLGRTIRHSNLCITGDQRVVTSLGYLTAKELNELDCELEVFDGKEMVPSSKMKLRGKQKDIYKVSYANGMTQKVTSEHGMAVMQKDGEISRVECKDLKIGDTVALQTKKGVFGEKHMPDEAFLLGLYQSDGTQHKGTIMLDVWENDFDIIDEIQSKFNHIHFKYGCDTYEIRNQTGKVVGTRSRKPAQFQNCTVAQSKVAKKRLASVTLKKALNFEKGYVPDWIWRSNEETQWEYLRGLLIADGTVNDCNRYGAPCQLAYVDTNREFLQELQILWTNLGLSSKIYLLQKAGKASLPDGKGGYKLYDRKAAYRLVISNKPDLLEVEKHTGFLSRKGNLIEDRVYRDNTKKRTKVVSIEYIGKEDVYCPTVHTEEHIFVSQGVKTFNCTEIALPNNNLESFVCCVGSLNLLHWAEMRKTRAIEVYVMLLNAVMTDFINKSKDFPGLERAHRFAKNHRAIGMGVLGYHSLLQSRMIPLESLEAKSLNNRIFKEISERANAESQRLCSELGITCIREGYANTTTMAIAPTKSSSYILAEISMQCEPYMSNYFVKDVAKGKTVFKNPFLEELLTMLGRNTREVWKDILDHDGSVQHLDWLPNKEVFKTFIEISPKELVIQTAQRQKYIDQAQSFNLFIHPSVSTKEINKLYIDAWKSGVKTLYYQFNQSAAQNFAREINSCVSCEG